MKESTAFRLVQFSSKSNPSNLFHSSTNYSINYSRISDLYLNDTLSQDSTNFINTRQQNYMLPKSATRSLNNGLDRLSTDTVLSYNYNTAPNLVDTIKSNSNTIAGITLTTADTFKGVVDTLKAGFNSKVKPLVTNLSTVNQLDTVTTDTFSMYNVNKFPPYLYTDIPEYQQELQELRE